MFYQIIFNVANPISKTISIFVQQGVKAIDGIAGKHAEQGERDSKEIKSDLLQNRNP